MIEVGGVVYASCLETLRKSPTLANLIDELPPEEMLFLDRDPQSFAYILNFLRTGVVYVSTDDRSYIELLKGEAAFYGLCGMESQLSEMLTEKTAL